MFLVANCLASFLQGCAKDRPETAKFIGKCADNVIAQAASLGKSESLVLLDSLETMSQNGVGSTENDCVVKFRNLIQT